MRRIHGFGLAQSVPALAHGPGQPELPYGKWREFDPEDALRFYALRMRELGMIKGAPNRIVTEGTDWRFWNELKKELKT